MGQIEFFADAVSFRAVKKMKVEAETDTIYIARALSSVHGKLLRKR